MGRVCYGPSLCRPTLLWAEFAMSRVCYGPRCPVTFYFNSQCLASLETNFSLVALSENQPMPID